MPATDEDTAIQAISDLASPSKNQEDAKAKIDAILTSTDPFLNIHELFSLYNALYFRSLLVPRVEVSWSSRLTLCAGICELVKDPDNDNRYTKVRLKLSEPLLKYRPRSDVIDTLLHEAIHAYFFITTSWRHSRGEDGSGHGAGFLLLADAINNHGDYNISVYHTFHDEVDSYRTHIWQCNGQCRQQPPFYGLVKRSMNRPPGKSDTWWQKHVSECGGSFTKIAEPEMTKEQVEKLSRLKRAGMQKNKLDTWMRDLGANSGNGDAHEEGTVGKRLRSTESEDVEAVKRPKTNISCPICNDEISMDMINEHLDEMHGK